VTEEVEEEVEDRSLRDFIESPPPTPFPKLAALPLGHAAPHAPLFLVDERILPARF
jgi:hypothetical protein